MKIKNLTKWMACAALALIGAMALNTMTAEAARTDTVWDVVLGSYIKTTNPLGYNVLINGTDKYLNFGITSGVSGYGFRDNGGTMEFKNSGGSWTGVGTGGGSGLTSLNGQTGSSQTFATSETGTNFTISSSADVHTFNLPIASGTNTGKLSSADWTTFNNKQAAGNYITDLTGDVTASGPGSVAATIANDAVTFAKMQNITTNRLLGRSTLGTGNTEEITPSTGLTLSGGNLVVADNYLFNTGDIGTGVFDFGGATSFELPNSIAPTVDADGEIAFDTTVTDFSTGALKFFGNEEQGIVSMPIAEFTSPSNGDVVTYNATNDEFELAAASGGVSETDTQLVYGTGSGVDSASTLTYAYGAAAGSKNLQYTSGRIESFNTSSAATGNYRWGSTAGGSGNDGLLWHTAGNIRITDWNGTVGFSFRNSDGIGSYTGISGSTFSFTNARLTVNPGTAVGLTSTTVNSTISQPSIDFADSGRGTEMIFTSTDGTTAGAVMGSYSNHPLMFITNQVLRAAFDTGGRFKIGGQPASGAWFQIKAGTTAEAQMNLSAGTLKTTPVNGDFENNNNWYFTKRNDVRFGIGGTLFDHFADVGNVGTGEDDLYSDSIPAGTLNEDGALLEAEYSGIFVSSATATRRIRVYFGGTAIYDSTALSVSSSTDWNIEASCMRESSSIVRCMTTTNTTTASAAPYATYARVTGLTLSNANTLKITGESAGVGAADNDIVAKFGKVKYESPDA